MDSHIRTIPFIRTRYGLSQGRISLVLAFTVKRVVFVVVGIIIFAFLAFVLGSFATNWYSDTLAKSDDDVNLSVKVFLILWPFLSALGGWFGNRLYYWFSR